ncbi:MAG: hypothetical protein ABW321_30575 [Polyangiales bacterium]
MLADPSPAGGFLLANGQLVYVGGLALRPSTIHLLALDGVTDTVLHEVAANQSIEDVWTEPDALYVTIETRGDFRESALYRLPYEGGALVPLPELTAGVDWRDAVIVASDADHFYVRFEDDLLRVSRATGQVAKIFTKEATFADYVLHDGTIWSTGGAGSDQLYQVPASATNAEPTLQNVRCTGELAVNDAGIFCGMDRVEADGTTTNLRVALGVQATSTNASALAASLSAEAFLGTKMFIAAGEGVHPIAEVDLETLEMTTLACGNVLWLTATDDAVYWVEGADRADEDLGQVGSQHMILKRAPR